MNRYFILCFCLFWPVFAVAHPQQTNKQSRKLSAAAGDTAQNDQSIPYVRLLPLPQVASPMEPVLTAEEKRHILGLIAQLADIVDTDNGISLTMGGDNFDPVPGSESPSVFVMTNQKKKPSLAMLELVKLGPRALPLLLTHLQDPTPTKLTLKHEGFFGSMDFGHEIQFNEVNPMEKTLRDNERKELPHRTDKPATTYQVKVGDICFNIVGQIVGRKYLAVRYQPTSNLVINSTVADAGLAQEVRSAWTSRTPTGRLFHSLLADYSSRGTNNDFSFYDRSINGDDAQCASAMRLLYYFPSETVPLIAKRLHRLQVQSTGGSAVEKPTDKEYALWTKRELANGVRTEEFVKAVSWCPDPRIQAEMAEIVTRTEVPNVMAAAVRGIAPSQRKRLTPAVQKMLHTKLSSESARHYCAEVILEALARYWSADARPIFEEYMRQKDPLDLDTVCSTLYGAGTDWDLALLCPLLSDKRPIPNTSHFTDPKGNGPQIPNRVCDAVARVLASSHTDLKFDINQPTAVLDRQIAALWMQAKH